MSMATERRDWIGLFQVYAEQFLRGATRDWRRQHRADVRQVARIAAWMADQQYDSERGKYATFIAYSVIRKLCNYYRDWKRKCGPWIELDALPYLQARREAVAGSVDPLERILTTEATEEAVRGMTGLPTLLARALYDHYWLELTDAEAGQRYGVSGNAIKHRRARGLARLGERG